MARHKPIFFDLPATGYVRQAQLVPYLLPVSSATFWRMVRRGDFPAGVKLAPRITAWRVEDVRKWMSERPCEQLKYI